MSSIHKEEEPWKWGGGTKATLPCYGFLGLWKKVHSPGGVGVGLTGALDVVLHVSFLLNPQEIHTGYSEAGRSSKESSSLCKGAKVRRVYHRGPRASGRIPGEADCQGQQGSKQVFLQKRKLEQEQKVLPAQGHQGRSTRPHPFLFPWGRRSCNSSKPLRAIQT